MSRYTTGVGVSYDLDLFGGAAREQEAVNARVEAEAFRREAARLTLASEVASKAIEIAAASAEVAAAELIVADGQATLRQAQAARSIAFVHKRSSPKTRLFCLPYANALHLPSTRWRF